MGFKIKYDSSKVDRSKTQVEPPKPGVYRLKIVEVKAGESRGGDPMLTFVSRVVDDVNPGKGYGFYDRVVLSDSSAWKLDQWLQAVGVDTEKKSKGVIDSDTFLNKEIMGRVKHDTYEGEYRPSLASVFLAVDDDDEDEDEDEDELFDEDESEEDEDDSEDEDEEDEEEEDEEDEEEEEEEDEDEEEEPAPKKTSAKKPAPKPAPKKGKARRPEYEDMELDELKEEAESRGLSAKGTKTALIARLRTHDDDPFA